MKVLYGAPRRGGRPNDSEEGQRASYTGAARLGQDLSLMTPGDEFSQDLYFTMYYNKTAQILAALRGVMGNDAFHRAFAAYGKAWVGKHPEPYDFFNAMSAGAGRDLSWFFTTWFYHGWPLNQGVDSVATVGDSTVIVICDMGLAPMPVPVAVTRADGSTQRLEIPVEAWLRNGGTRRLVLRVAAEPRVTRVVLDPDGLFPDVDRRNEEWPTPPR
jgi:aminopeptidase N